MQTLSLLPISLGMHLSMQGKNFPSLSYITVPHPCAYPPFFPPPSRSLPHMYSPLLHVSQPIKCGLSPFPTLIGWFPPTRNYCLRRGGRAIGAVEGAGTAGSVEVRRRRHGRRGGYLARLLGDGGEGGENVLRVGGPRLGMYVRDGWWSVYIPYCLEGE